MSMTVRADVPVAELVFSTLYEGKMLVDAIRVQTSVPHLKRMADVICQNLDHYPTRATTSPKKK
jgi:hypothetical protein